jgi:hypothetical protein
MLEPHRTPNLGCVSHRGLFAVDQILQNAAGFYASSIGTQRQIPAVRPAIEHPLLRLKNALVLREGTVRAMWHSALAAVSCGECLANRWQSRPVRFVVSTPLWR